MPKISDNKKGLVLLNAYTIVPGLGQFAYRLQDEFSRLGVQIDVKTNEEIYAFINGDGLIPPLNSQYDFCIFLDKDPYISHLLEKSGLHLFDNADAIELCDDKMKTYLTLANHGIEMPKTVPGPLRYVAPTKDAFLRNLEKELSYPIVIKENFGSQGQNVYLAHDFGELKEIDTRIGDNPRLFQEMIPSSFGEDFRLIIIGGQFIAGMKRSSQGKDFRSNLGQGGIGEIVEMPDSYKALAIKAATILHLDYCGVDLLQGSHGEPILCEVNSNAFVTGIEKTTSINVTKAYAEHIIKTIY